MACRIHTECALKRQEWRGGGISFSLSLNLYAFKLNIFEERLDVSHNWRGRSASEECNL